jgi:hypothetical protein
MDGIMALEYRWNKYISINPLNAVLNHIHHLLTLLGIYPIFHISRIRVKGDNVEQIKIILKL